MLYRVPRVSPGVTASGFDPPDLDRPGRPPQAAASTGTMRVEPGLPRRGTAVVPNKSLSLSLSLSRITDNRDRDRDYASANSHWQTECWPGEEFIPKHLLSLLYCRFLE